LALVGAGAAVVPLDTAVNIGFPDITRSFGLPIQMIQWVVICYVLTYASLMLAFGRAGDIFGHVRVFRAGLAWSAAAFLLCAAAPAYGWLLFCRFLQGIGAGLVISVAPALVTALYPEEQRGRAAAAFSMIFALASALGPLIGGALVGAWGWPAVFWFRAPIALTVLLCFRGPVRRSGREPGGGLDVSGAVLLALIISAFLLFLNEVPRLSPTRPIAPVLLALAAAGSVLFVRRERRIAAPIVELAYFARRSFTAINLASVLVYLTSFAVLLFAPYYLVGFAGMALPTAGAVIGLSFAGAMVAAPVAGRLLDRWRACDVAALGAALGGIGLAAVGSAHSGSAGALAGLLAALLVQGFGVGLFQVAYLDAVLATLPPGQRGVAGSIAMLTRTLGIVSGASLLTLAFHAVEKTGMAAGATAPAAFITAFRATMWAAGASSVLAGAAAMAFARPARN
jgi:MFS family permease